MLQLHQCREWSHYVPDFSISLSARVFWRLPCLIQSSIFVAILIQRIHRILFTHRQASAQSSNCRGLHGHGTSFVIHIHRLSTQVYDHATFTFSSALWRIAESISKSGVGLLNSSICRAAKSPHPLFLFLLCVCALALESERIDCRIVQSLQVMTFPTRV